MPRVYDQKKSNRGATRHCGRCGAEILAGERYFQWSFRYGGTRYNCYRHFPRSSELTQSKMATVYAAVESAEDGFDGAGSVEEVVELVRAVGEAAREVSEEYNEAAEAMGSAGESGESRERADQLETVADECEQWEPEVEDDSDGDDHEAQLRELVEGSMREDGLDPDDEAQWVSVFEARMVMAEEEHLLERIQAEKEVLVAMVLERHPPGTVELDGDMDDPLVRAGIGKTAGFSVNDGEYADRVEERVEELVDADPDEGDDPVDLARQEASDFLSGLDIP